MRKIDSKDCRMESRYCQLQEQSDLHKTTMEHAGKAQSYLEQIADAVAFTPKTPSSDKSHTEGGPIGAQETGSERETPVKPVPE